MEDYAISVHGISKRYSLGQKKRHHGAKGMFQGFSELFGRAPQEDHSTIWALKDVSFEVKKGERLGFVGKNGAGKSTLLKILSRVAYPTAGEARIRGRVTSLLEVGTGFLNHLTGRQNIYLNASFHGLSKKETELRIPDIVEFSELERFIDTPIKFYSSGMQMRLGFSVAAHTDPDILLIDEILAVGDASFQAKCLNKLAELKEQDKTIILVSHHLANITEHSKTVVWLDRGAVRLIGEPEAVVNAYLEHVTAGMAAAAAGSGLTPDAGRMISILNVATSSAGELPRTAFDRGDTVLVDITYSAATSVPGAVFGVSIQDVHGYPLGGVVTDPDSIKIAAPVERAVLRLTLDPLLFNRGTYTLSVHVQDPRLKKYYDLRRRAARITVDGHRASGRDATGYIHYPHQWEQLR